LPKRAYQLLYLFRDESVESTQAYQLASVSTLPEGQAPPQKVLQRFPIDGITAPWDVRPPAALSPDGKTLAMVQWDEAVGRVLLLDAVSGAATTVPGIRVTGVFSPTVLGWAPDGTRVYLYDETQPPGRVRAYTPASGQVQTLFTLDDVAPQSGLELLSPDARRFAYCAQVVSRGCSVFAIRAMAGGAPTLAAMPGKTACLGYPALKWAPDSALLAVGCVTNLTNHALQLIDPATGAVRTVPMPFEVNDFAWSADSRQLLVDLCAGNYVNVTDPDCGPLRLVDVPTGAIQAGPALERTEARRLFWLGDTLILNESSGGGQEATMYFYSISSRQSRQFTRNASTYADASFTVLAIRPVP
jgi:dipeptidyl aminopeptidase/acylaminoacyl peptidase